MSGLEIVRIIKSALLWIQNKQFQTPTVDPVGQATPFESYGPRGRIQIYISLYAGVFAKSKADFPKILGRGSLFKTKNTFFMVLIDE